MVSPTWILATGCRWLPSSFPSAHERHASRHRPDYGPAVLLYSTSVPWTGTSATATRTPAGTAASDELFALDLERVRQPWAHLHSRRRYETMLPWENDPPTPHRARRQQRDGSAPCQGSPLDAWVPQTLSAREVNACKRGQMSPGRVKVHTTCFESSRSHRNPGGPHGPLASSGQAARLTREQRGALIASSRVPLPPGCEVVGRQGLALRLSADRERPGGRVSHR
jgi:hypothetical protein